MSRRWAYGWGAWLSCLLCGGALAQFVSGDWVERSEARVQEHRTTPVSFLVLDVEGKLAPNATIRLEQLEHAFRLGFIAHGDLPAKYNAEAEVWRTFNAVSLEKFTTWRQMQPDGPESFSRDAVDRAIAAAQSVDLEVRWGSLASADTFDLPDWVVPLRGEALFEAWRGYSDRIADAYGPELIDIDLAEETLDHDRLSPAMIRLIAQDWRAVRQDLQSRLRYEQVLAGSRTFAAIEAMDGVLKQRLGIEGFTIDKAFPPRAVAQDLLEPAVQRLSRFGRPIAVGSLEIGGAHAIETAVNTETVLRTLFANPMITGIYFSGLSPDEVSDPSAAVFDEQGEPTAVGRTIDRLFRETWWTDTTLTSDKLGKAQAEVYRGRYRVTATLPDGSSVTTTLSLLEQEVEPSEIILMPVAESE
ncbi:MAG: hypothetical protein AAF663_13290 [Planctomycetota bacterium]